MNCAWLVMMDHQTFSCECMVRDLLAHHTTCNGVLCEVVYHATCNGVLCEVVYHATCNGVLCEVVYHATCNGVLCEVVYHATCNGVLCEVVYHATCNGVLCEVVCRSIAAECAWRKHNTNAQARSPIVPHRELLNSNAIKYNAASLWMRNLYQFAPSSSQKGNMVPHTRLQKTVQPFRSLPLAPAPCEGRQAGRQAGGVSPSPLADRAG
jgi:hypothetical protein